MTQKPEVITEYVDVTGTTCRPGDEVLTKLKSLLGSHPEKEIYPLTVAVKRKFRIMGNASAYSGEIEFPGNSIVEENIHYTEFSIPETFKEGYYTIKVSVNGRESQTELAVTPERCFVPEGYFTSGISLQLYAIRSKENWGVGDFRDLSSIVAWAGQLGFKTVGVNPLHALYPANPAHHAPYSPSSRYFLNFIYIHPDSIPDFEGSEAEELTESHEFQTWKQQRQHDSLIDYRSIGEKKLQVLKLVFHHFLHKEYYNDTVRAVDFKKYLELEGEFLFRHALFDSLFERFSQGRNSVYSWLDWPEDFRNVHSPDVKQYAEENKENILFYQYIQWIASTQIEEVRRLAASHDVRLYLDLAVGVTPGGAEVWSYPESYCMEASIGAPPDPFSPSGQNWGLTPMHPVKLKEHGYYTFINILRKNMIRGGILRMDHVMGLFRLYWNVSGGGGYISYPSDELLGLVCLESILNECIVIGEDLGTVPPGVHEKLMEASLFSWKVLYFEKEWNENQSFRRPELYPEMSVATVNTHDLPTLTGWWDGIDIDDRKRLGLASEESIASMSSSRLKERKQLLEILQQLQIGPEWIAEENRMSMELVSAVHQFLAKTKSKLILVSIYDLLLERKQPNLPGTTDAYPNWSLRLSEPLAVWMQSESVRKIANAVTSIRRS